MGQRCREQRRRQAAILLAGGVDDAAGVPGVRRAAGVDQQPQQPLRLRPALDRILLVNLPRVLGHPPDPGVGLVPATDPALGKREQHDLDALSALVARPGTDHVDGDVERLGVPARGDLLQRAQPQLRVAVALQCAQQKSAAQLPLAIEVQHRLGSTPAVGSDACARERRPHVLLPVVEVFHRDPPQLPFEDLSTPLGIRRHRQHAALHRTRGPWPRRTGPHGNRAAAVDVAIQQRVQRDDGVVVLGGRVDEVDHDPGLLAGMPA